MPKRAGLQRHLISAPIGPVKNSRGPDLVRGDDFQVVGGIKDCAINSTTSSESIASRRSRRISASFLNMEPPSTSPTVAESEISSVTRIVTSYRPPTASFRKKRTALSLSTRSLLNQPSKYTLLARAGSAESAENVPPLDMEKCQDEKSTGPKIASKLPKSRTMTVLHELKKSFSRQTLSAVRSSNSSGKRSPRHSPRLRKLEHMGSSNSTLPSSATTPTSACYSDISPSPAAVNQDGRIIVTAQSSEYWSGRFVALKDRFSSEDLLSDDNSSSSSTPQPADDRWQTRRPTAVHQSLAASRSRLTYLASSNTTSALTTMTYNNTASHVAEDKDDLICKRIFSHLTALCTTSEAKESLHSWQQAYARRFNRPQLLPEGAYVDVKRGKTKVLGAGGRLKGAEKRGRSALKGLPIARSGTLAMNSVSYGVSAY